MHTGIHKPHGVDRIRVFFLFLLILCSFTFLASKNSPVYLPISRKTGLSRSFMLLLMDYPQ